MSRAKLISPITRQEVEKTRVCAYCRVSSNSADQLNSYAHQIQVYTKLIQKRKDWQLVEIFADEGLTGTKSENRTEFQRMIQMAEAKQIDLIIVKSVSRFARNITDSLEYCRQLKLLGVAVQFEKEGINTLALGDEMLLNTFSAIAQEESVAISQNQRLSIVKRMENGTYVDSNAPYGFRLVNKLLAEYEPESIIVKRIFEAYLNGKSATEIARQLQEDGIPTKNGKIKWKSTTITYILSNEKYIGDSLFQKTYRSPTVPFKQSKNRGHEDQYSATDTHIGFVDRDTFAKVQELLAKRQKTHLKTTTFNQYPLSSHIQCTECGSFYRRRLVSGTVKWACTKHIENRTACNSNYYSEERIYEGFTAMINKLRFGDENILAQVILRLETATNQYKKNSTTAYELSQQIAELNAKLHMLEQLRGKGYLAPDVYHAQAMDINKQLSKLKSNRQESLDTRILAMLQEVKQLKALLDEIEVPLDTFDQKLFEDTVVGITINKKDEMTITTLGGLKFTEVI